MPADYLGHLAREGKFEAKSAGSTGMPRRRRCSNIFRRPAHSREGVRAANA